MIDFKYVVHGTSILFSSTGDYETPLGKELFKLHNFHISDEYEQSSLKFSTRILIKSYDIFVQPVMKKLLQFDSVSQDMMLILSVDFNRNRYIIRPYLEYGGFVNNDNYEMLHEFKWFYKIVIEQTFGRYESCYEREAKNIDSAIDDTFSLSPLLKRKAKYEYAVIKWLCDVNKVIYDPDFYKRVNKLWLNLK